MPPFTFSNIVTAIIIFSIGLSVLIRDRKRFPNQGFFLFTLFFAIYFLCFGLIPIIENPILKNLQLLFGVASGFTGVAFFLYFLSEKIDKTFSSIYAIFSLASISLIIYSYFFISNNPSKFISYFIFIHGALSFFSIITGILIVKNITHSITKKERLSYFLMSTVAFSLFFLVSHSKFFVGAVYYLGNIASILYLYFLSHTLLKYRIMDFKESLGHMLVILSTVFATTAIYLSLLFWIPNNSGEYLFLNLVVGSIAVFILFNPFHSLIEGLITKLMFWQMEELKYYLIQLEKKLNYVQESEKKVGNLVMEYFKKSKRVTHSAIYLFDNEDVLIHKLSCIGEIPVSKLSISSLKNLIERFSYKKVITTSEIEQEIERLKRGWALPLGGEALETILTIMKTSFNAYCIYPIYGNKKLIGFLTINDDRIKQPFSRKEILIFSQLTEKIGNSLTNFNRFKKARERERLAVLGQMAAGLAHEIRNPLSAIKGSVQLLADDLEYSGQSEFLTIIEEEVGRLGRVVSTFLDFARTPGKLENKVSINQIVEKSLPLLNSVHSNITVLFEKSAESPEIMGDFDKIQQLIINLVINGKQACEKLKNPEIKINTKQKNNKFELHVKDNGKGIKENDLKSIFLPFYTTKNKGTGLGLSICKKIVESHGGELHVKTKPNKGTTFKAIFPLN
jgi:two-component system, NtrC family, sensor histidine kinase HydH